LEHAIRELSADHRTALTLARIEGLTVKEIAHRMNRGIVCVLVLLTAVSAAQADDKDEDPKLVEYREHARKNKGNPGTGKKVFETDKAACARCHAVGSAERKAGPNLLGIADKYARSQLIDHVLRPGAEILAGYGTTVVVTRTGEVVTGIVEKRGEEALELFAVKGEVRRIPTKDIAKEENSAASLMPEGLQRELAPAEFTDLIAYL
jgi:putative heme-binding domain-containing protein